MRRDISGDTRNKTRVSGNGTAGEAVTRPIATMGEVFRDASMLELIRNSQHREPELWLWDGEKEFRGARVSYKGHQYEPKRIDPTLLQHLTLPIKCCAHRSTGKLLAEICRVIEDFVGLGEKSTEIAGRMVLGSAVVDSMQIAPSLMVVGPDVARGEQFMSALRCLCRHALPLTGVTPASFRSLPSGGLFTFMIAQPTVSPSLQNLFEDARKRVQKIPCRGRLLDLFGLQIIRSESFLAGGFCPHRSIQIPMIPAGRALPVFDEETQERIATEFQAKLLDFRRAKLSEARALKFDDFKFDPTLRDLARSLVTATPDDPDLRGKVFDLLREDDMEVRLARWVDPNVVAVEAVLVACHESLGDTIYVSELSRIAEATLVGRGEHAVTIDPGRFGKRLKFLGFVAEARDAKGVRMRLTEEVRSHALALARDLGAPEDENVGARNAGVAD